MDLLRSCYATSLKLATQHRLGSITFPATSTGVYQFPPDRAARIAVGTVAAQVSDDPHAIKQIVFCCFSLESARHHKDAFAELNRV